MADSARERARCTGGVDSRRAAGRPAARAPEDGRTAGAPGADAEVAAAPGSARSGATGTLGAAAAPPGAPSGIGPAGRSMPVTGDPDVPGMRGSSPAPAAGSSTPGDDAPVNEGFCQVASSPPKALCATPVPPAREASRTGGSPDQEGAEAGGDTGAGDAAPPAAQGSGLPAASGPPAPRRSPPRPRSRSRNPTVQPSAVPRVTRDAI